jgi:hypothetical protein
MALVQLCKRLAISATGEIDQVNIAGDSEPMSGPPHGTSLPRNALGETKR